MPLPTDGFVPVSDLEFYLLGKMTEQDNSADKTSPNETSDTSQTITPTTGGTEQQYGHQLN